MAEYDRQYSTAARGGAGARVGVDEGLRAFMLGIYNNMAMGLADHRPRRLRRLLRAAFAERNPDGVSAARSTPARCAG